MPGASVLVMRGDTVVLRESVGLADVEGGVAATPATNYRLASLSKQVTATVVLLLVRDGALSLDRRVRELLPELPAYAAEVTVRHLLTHTSGLWDYEDFVPDSAQQQVRDKDALSLVSARAERLYFAPGSAWRYSNTGYALLALIVERLSGQRYADVLRTRVFLPLGMTGTYAHEEGRTVVPHRAWGYTVRSGTVARTDQSSTSAVLGDGGIYSSIDDLSRWHASLTRAPIVGDALWALTRTPHPLADGGTTGYGFGWFVDRHLGHARLRHHGETRGFTNAVSRYPDAGLTIVVLTNRSDSAPWSIADALAAAYLTGEIPPPATPRAP
jgi:CubicO group peptidase (beta-lactamase class C family)